MNFLKEVQMLSVNQCPLNSGRYAIKYEFTLFRLHFSSWETVSL